MSRGESPGQPNSGSESPQPAPADGTPQPPQQPQEAAGQQFTSQPAPNKPQQHSLPTSNPTGTVEADLTKSDNVNRDPLSTSTVPSTKRRTPAGAPDDAESSASRSRRGRVAWLAAFLVRGLGRSILSAHAWAYRWYGLRGLVGVSMALFVGLGALVLSGVAPVFGLSAASVGGSFVAGGVIALGIAVLGGRRGAAQLRLLEADHATESVARRAIARLDDPNGDVRERALQVVRTYSGDDPAEVVALVDQPDTVVDSVLPLVAEENRAARVHAVELSVVLARDYPAATVDYDTVLLEAIQREHSRTRARAAVALGNLALEYPDRAARYCTALDTLRTDRDPTVRQAVCVAYAHLPAAYGRAPLRDLANDTHPGVSETAADWLATLNAPDRRPE